MSAPLDSPPMALVRQIASVLALLAAGIVMFGCGGPDQPSSADIDPATAASINDKLDQIEERVAASDCFGDNSAESSLATLQSAVGGELLANEDEAFRTDLEDLLNQLGDQLQTDPQCSAETTSTSTTSTISTTEPTETTPSTTSTETSTTSTPTKTTTTTEPDTTAVPPVDGPPAVPPGQEGDEGSGGVSPGGFGPGREAGKKPKKPKDGGP